MAQPYIGEIRMFAGNFAPVGWMFCEGQLVAISDNETLFQLIGTTYGGDGEETFGLPDLRGRLPLHFGTSSQSGTTYQLAQSGGVEEVALTNQQVPIHNHQLLANAGGGTTNSPQGSVLGASPSLTMYRETTPSAGLAVNATTPVGGSQPHTNFQPYLCVDFIISMFGIFPSPT